MAAAPPPSSPFISPHSTPDSSSTTGDDEGALQQVPIEEAIRKGVEGTRQLVDPLYGDADEAARVLRTMQPQGWGIVSPSGESLRRLDFTSVIVRASPKSGSFSADPIPRSYRKDEDEQAANLTGSSIIQPNWKLVIGRFASKSIPCHFLLARVDLSIDGNSLLTVSTLDIAQCVNADSHALIDDVAMAARMHMRALASSLKEADSSNTCSSAQSATAAIASSQHASGDARKSPREQILGLKELIDGASPILCAEAGLRVTLCGLRLTMPYSLPLGPLADILLRAVSRCGSILLSRPKAFWFNEDETFRNIFIPDGPKTLEATDLLEKMMDDKRNAHSPASSSLSSSFSSSSSSSSLTSLPPLFECTLCRQKWSRVHDSRPNAPQLSRELMLTLMTSLSLQYHPLAAWAEVTTPL